VCRPAVEVSRRPLPPLCVLVAVLSSQDDSPGPPAPSEHEKLLLTRCPFE
jgi:hypothetical protein